MKKVVISLGGSVIIPDEVDYKYLKKFILEIELARFGYVLGSLLDAGIPIVNALESLTNSSALYFYKNFYDFLTTNIKLEVGTSFF